MKNVLEYLEATATKYPHKIGFTDADGEATFAQVMEHARRIASALSGIERNTPVALIIDRSIACIESMLAVAYAGCFYTVIDVNAPEDRIVKILQTLSPKAVITHGPCLSLTQRVWDKDTPILYEAAAEHGLREDFLEAARNQMVDTDPLYVLFTSGSTGTPKGAVLSHRSVISYTEWASRTFAFGPSTVFGAQTPLYFSMSVTDLYGTIKCGCLYHMIPKVCFSFPLKLVEFLNSKEINTIYWVPSALAILANWDVFSYEKPRCLETVLFAGEAISTKHLNYWMKFLPHCTYVNLFGPTEATDICSFYVVDRTFQDGERLPIGKACDNCQVFLVTESGQPAAPEEAGEIMIRGSFLAEGYYRDPEKTADAFIQNPLHDAYPDRVYRTGDLAMLDRQGMLRYLGRKDAQIKRMGYRIELGEIEAAADALQEIKASAALYQEPRNRILLVYEGKKADPALLLGKIEGRLPAYMRPDEIIRVKQMPRNANGKTDRLRLKERYI